MKSSSKIVVLDGSGNVNSCNSLNLELDYKISNSNYDLQNAPYNSPGVGPKILNRKKKVR